MTWLSARGVGASLMIAALSAGLEARAETLPVSPVVGEQWDADTVLRLDVILNAIVPVARESLIPGGIYNHYSPVMQRRVWSFYQADGTFWSAMGEGTTQDARSFDIRGSREEAEKRLAEMPGLAAKVQSSGERVSLRLRADDRWAVIGAGFLRSVYNAETGQRWEKHGPDYISVLSTSSDRWTAVAGRYHPQ
jgi:hypothetical protein